MERLSCIEEAGCLKVKRDYLSVEFLEGHISHKKYFFTFRFGDKKLGVMERKSVA